MGVWSYLRQFTYTKFVIVVDDDIDARDWNDVVWALSTNVDPARDMTVIENTPIDYLDFASPETGLGSKLGIDATAKIGAETKREWGRKIRMSDDIVHKVTEKWVRYGLPGSGGRSGSRRGNAVPGFARRTAFFRSGRRIDVGGPGLSVPSFQMR